MTAVDKWTPELFTSAIGGVNSGLSPELVGPTSLSWAFNCSVRGGKPHTRPPYRFVMVLPPGLVQGAGYFGIQQGMIVLSIRGRLWRLRVNSKTPSWTEIGLPWRNSSLIKQVWMCQTVESLVVQDFESDPIIYNGSTARRSDPYGRGGDPEVPRGKMMAYGNGRLFVAVNDWNLAAGDIRRKVAESELKFTERNFLLGGGDMAFSSPIRALFFISTNGSSDLGPLIVAGANCAESERADISARDQWGGPGFVTNVLRATGCASQWSVAPVNQDVYWRDSDGGLRSIYSAGTDESTAGNSALSREVSRLVDHDSKQLLSFASSIYFDNRLLVTSSPYLNEVGGVSWRDLVALDFAPYSAMQGKMAPAYDGQWAGLPITHLVTGRFAGRQRAFAIAHHPSGTNSLWEIMPGMAGQRDDESLRCSASGPIQVLQPIQSYLETGRRNFGDPRVRKRLERTDLYLSGIEGPVTMKVWWRRDNTPKWYFWDQFSVEARMTRPAGVTSRLNMYPQQRAQVKTLTIPSDTFAADGTALQTGFEFQLRVSWTGKCTLYKTVLFASPLPETPFARRELVSADPALSDSTGNEITYLLPLDAGVQARIVTQPVAASILAGGDAQFSVAAIGTDPISYQWQVSSGSGGPWTDLADGGVYAGTATDTLAITAAAVDLSGKFYRCLANNGWTEAGCVGPAASVPSDAAELTVTVPAEVRYQWQAQIATIAPFDTWVNVPNETDSEMTISNAVGFFGNPPPRNTNQYRCSVYCADGVEIIQQPVDDQWFGAVNSPPTFHWTIAAIRHPGNDQNLLSNEVTIHGDY